MIRGSCILLPDIWGIFSHFQHRTPTSISRRNRRIHPLMIHSQGNQGDLSSSHRPSPAPQGNQTPTHTVTAPHHTHTRWQSAATQNLVLPAPHTLARWHSDAVQQHARAAAALAGRLRGRAPAPAGRVRKAEGYAASAGAAIAQRLPRAAAASRPAPCPPPLAPLPARPPQSPLPAGLPRTRPPHPPAAPRAPPCPPPQSSLTNTRPHTRAAPPRRAARARGRAVNLAGPAPQAPHRPGATPTPWLCKRRNLVDPC